MTNRRVAILLAIIAGLAPLKFGNPVVSQALGAAPRGFFEWLIFVWPNEIGVMLCVATLIWFIGKRVRGIWVWLPLVWLVIQVMAVPGSINRQVSVDTVLHFGVCVLLFYVARQVTAEDVGKVFGALTVALIVTCAVALEQHFGGLVETRQFVEKNLQGAQLPEDYRLRLTSDRVFGTLVYPNALAGFLVLAAAPMVVWTWKRKWVSVAVVGLMGWVMVLTGSRGGMLALGAVAVTAGLMKVAGGVLKWILVGLVTVVVIAAISMRAGTSSLEARLDYWKGAVAITKDYPLLGTGPGTFGSIYPKYKTAQTEEAQLVHNNFLEQGCDSGLLGLLVFAALWGGAIWKAVRRARQGDAMAVALCAALVGFVVHGLVDFDLYVPGVAWPAFILLGMIHE